ncbi:MAG: dTDP-4-dehydrorhamnose 3,5-epimerase family protein [Verrucomicrobiae bacterium]|nr:dTDP-4-dehydrorhamnose 3,5-epimerase family protein [Verrucomicrobiae bacterium]
MQKIPTEIDGLFQLVPEMRHDARGFFVKNFNTDLFSSLGLDFTPREEFFSRSARGVLRGMHFQTPPFEGVKVVTCLDGRVLDVVLDLRKNSRTFGKTVSFELDGTAISSVFIPPGCAHGFRTLSETAFLFYSTGSVYSPAHDQGILWSGFGFDWGTENPLLSDRDRTFPTLDEFSNPF